MRRVHCRHPHRRPRPTLDVIDPLLALCPPLHGSNCGGLANAPEVSSMDCSPFRSLSFSLHTSARIECTCSPARVDLGFRRYILNNHRKIAEKTVHQRNSANSAPVGLHLSSMNAARTQHEHHKRGSSQEEWNVILNYRK